MTDPLLHGLAVLAGALLLAACFAAWRRWGWPAVLAVLGAAWGLVGTVAALVRRRPTPAPSTAGDVPRARVDVAEQRRDAEKAIDEAQQAREGADGRRTAVEAQDVHELVADGIRRSTGRA